MVKARLSIGLATDRRLNLINKLIQGIQTIKIYVWEEPILSHIQHSRRVECRRFLKLQFWKGFSDGIYRNANVIMAFPIVLVPLAQGRPLVASTIFTALSVAYSLAYDNMMRLNYGMGATSGYYSVIKRIESVLLLKEKEEEPISE